VLPVLHPYKNVCRRLIVKRKHHLLFLCVTFCFWFSSYAYVPILSPYLSSMGATYVFTGIILGSYGTMQVLLRFPIGIFSDFIKIKTPFIWIGLAAAIYGSIGMKLSNNLSLFLLFRIISGISA